MKNAFIFLAIVIGVLFVSCSKTEDVPIIDSIPIEQISNEYEANNAIMEQNRDTDHFEYKYWVTNEYIRYFSNIGFFAGKIIVNNGFLPLLEDDLHDCDLAVLTKDELRILRNTVYAKYGLIFQSDDLREHFSRFDWYNPRFYSVDGKMTTIDKRIIDRISSFENAQPNNNCTKQDLVGEWLGSYPVAAGDYNDMRINDDNTIIIGYNSMYPKASWSCSGTYSIENGYLVVLIMEQSIYIGEYFHNGYGSVIGGMDGKNDNFGVIKYNEPVRMVFPVGEMGVHPYFTDKFMRQIGSQDRFR